MYCGIKLNPEAKRIRSSGVSAVISYVERLLTVNTKKPLQL